MAHELRVEGDKVIESDSTGHVVATKDYAHVHAGYIATLHNPRVSHEAKQAAEKLLHELEAAHGDKISNIVWDDKTAAGGGGGDDKDDVHRHRQIGAYKGILHKHDVSDEAKQHARDMLKQFGVDPDQVENQGGGTNKD